MSNISAQRPIGVFDSGMGGLTVLAALRARLPGEDFVYLGDTARLPYGTKSAATVVKYAAGAARHLQRYDIKALVVACNTASGLALAALRAQLPELLIVGVVEPGAQAAVATADARGILVLATESTIAGGAYQTALQRRAPHLPVRGRAAPLWVTLAEMGTADEALVDAVLTHDLGLLQQTDAPGTLLLGCTHFPVFRAAISRLVAPDVQVVDSASTTAQAVAEELAALELNHPSVTGGRVRYLATDGQARFTRVAPLFLGETVDAVELIDL
ncbi:MAG: glutamate racemase [Pseudomonadota bacterium]